jgi:type I restriction enzyme R subunit
MIGRGTRSQEACHYLDRLPNREKKGFRVIDFWENDFNKPASEELKQSLPVLVSLFNTRLKLLEQYLQSNSHTAEQAAIIARLRVQIALIPVDSFSIKKFMDELEQVQQDQFWQYLTPDKIDFLKLKIAPLLRYSPGVNVEETTFTHKVERLKLQNLGETTSPGVAHSIADDVSCLPSFVFENQKYQRLANLCLAPQKLHEADAKTLDHIIDLLAPQMSNKRDKVNPFLNLDLPDYVDLHGYILLRGGTERIYVQEYKKRVEENLLQLIDNHPIIAAIGKNETVTDEQLIELERTLHQTLGGEGLELTPEHIRMAYGTKVGSLIEFLRFSLALDGIPDYNDIIRRQFTKHIQQHSYNKDQLKFLSLVQNVFLQRRHLQLADLYDAPFASLGEDAVERLFTPEQIQVIIDLTDTLRE